MSAPPFQALVRRIARSALICRSVPPPARLACLTRSQTHSPWDSVSRNLLLHIAWVRLSRSQTLSLWERVARSLLIGVAGGRQCPNQTLSLWERVARSAG